jgi:hypothetical protein
VRTESSVLHLNVERDMCTIHVQSMSSRASRSEFVEEDEAPYLD